MKPLHTLAAVLAAAMMISSSAYADRDDGYRMEQRYDRGYDRSYVQRYDRGYDRGYYAPSRHVRMPYNRHHDNWVVPLVIGGVLGYVLSEPRQETVTYTSTVRAPAVYSAQPVYEERWVYFGDCDCQRKVLVQVR